eukprot:1246196-Lingulodinium_polyedra.AAC.1
MKSKRGKSPQTPSATFAARVGRDPPASNPQITNNSPTPCQHLANTPPTTHQQPTNDLRT